MVGKNRVIYREPGNGRYLAGYQGFLFTKEAIMSYARYVNKNNKVSRLVYLKDQDRFAMITSPKYGGEDDYYDRGAIYQTVDGMKKLYNIMGTWWMVADKLTANSRSKRAKKTPAPFGL